jgi:beta-phosphoglucomutase-like phosphatase (HAD superfamily)
MDRTMKKIKQTGTDKYFSNDRIFTADMVKNGKPEPDLFLLAADKMGYAPQDAIVIEDSTVGVMAAQKAGIKVIAFVRYNTPEVKKLVEDLQPDFMVNDMRETKNILLDFYHDFA